MSAIEDNGVAGRILSRLLGQPEEINGGERCPTYLYRWPVIKKRKSGRAVYIHHFVGDDWSRDRHDHPKRFITIGLWGRYIEETPAGSHCYSAPWIRSFPATHIHRIRTRSVGSNCWTLCIVLKIEREWGFWPNGIWVQWEKYVHERGGAADKNKSCE